MQPATLSPEVHYEPDEAYTFHGWMLKPLGWFIQTATIAVFLPWFYQAIIGTVPGLFAMLTMLVGPLLCLMWLCRFLFRIAYLFHDIRLQYRRRGWFGYALLPFCITLPCFVWETCIVQKAGLWFVRLSLETMVQDKSRSGKQSGLKAGPYSILDIERNTDEVRLRVSQGDFGTSVTYAGFSHRINPPDVNDLGNSRYTKLTPEWYWYTDSGRD